jgi:hypothetical protein
MSSAAATSLSSRVPSPYTYLPTHNIMFPPYDMRTNINNQQQIMSMGTQVRTLPMNGDSTSAYNY